MKNIDHLPEEEKKHYILCDCCSYVDMRDLSEVFDHLHITIPKPNWSHSVKRGEPAAFPRRVLEVNLN